MRYLNDVLLNLDEIAYDFYEWQRNDDIKKYKRIPIIHISNQALRVMLQYRVIISKKWLDKHNFKKPILIFTTRNDNLAIEFREDGKELYRSRLTLEDDLKVCEASISLNQEKISFQKAEKVPILKELRVASREKQMIEIELKTIEASHNFEKLSYLYYEWFKEIGNTFEDMLDRCKKELTKDYNNSIHEIGSLIRLSYQEKL